MRVKRPLSRRGNRRCSNVAVSSAAGDTRACDVLFSSEAGETRGPHRRTLVNFERSRDRQPAALDYAKTRVDIYIRESPRIRARLDSAERSSIDLRFTPSLVSRSLTGLRCRLILYLSALPIYFE